MGVFCFGGVEQSVLDAQAASGGPAADFLGYFARFPDLVAPCGFLGCCCGGGGRVGVSGFVYNCESMCRTVDCLLCGAYLQRSWLVGTGVCACDHQFFPVPESAASLRSVVREPGEANSSADVVFVCAGQFLVNTDVAQWSALVGSGAPDVQLYFVLGVSVARPDEVFHDDVVGSGSAWTRYIFDVGCSYFRVANVPDTGIFGNVSHHRCPVRLLLLPVFE